MRSAMMRGLTFLVGLGVAACGADGASSTTEAPPNEVVEDADDLVEVLADVPGEISGTDVTDGEPDIADDADAGEDAVLPDDVPDTPGVQEDADGLDLPDIPAETDSDSDTELDADASNAPDLEDVPDPNDGDLPDAGDDTEDGPDADGPDTVDTAGDGTDGSESADLTPPPPCNLETPRRFYDRLVQAGTTGLLAGSIAGAGETAVMIPFGPDLGPGVNPPTVRPGAVGDAEVIVSSADSGTCRVVGLDATGGIVFKDSFPASGCASPALLPEGFAVSTRTGDQTTLRFYGPDALLVGTLTLPGTSPAGPVAMGPSLIVAHGQTLSWVRPPGDLPATAALVLASAETGLESVVRIAIGGDGLLLVTGRSSLVVEGLGDRILRVTALDAPAQLTVLPVIELPGAALADTVLLDGCLDPLANGSSHWWCPQGLIAAAGAGWLAVYSADTGAPVLVESVPGIDFTGLASLDDGRFLGLGAAVQGGSVVRALDLQTAGSQSSQLTNVDFGAPHCIGSPVADSDGSVYATSNNNLFRLATTTGGHGPGWARSGGDAEGAGRAFEIGGPCPGSDAILFSRDTDTPTGETITTALALSDGDLVVAGSVPGGTNVSQGFLARFSSSGFIRWSLAAPTDAQAFADVTLAGSRLIAVGNDGSGGVNPVIIVAVDPDAQFQFELDLTEPDTSMSAIAVATLDDDTVVVLARAFPLFVLGVDVLLFQIDVGAAVPAATSPPVSLDWPGTGSPTSLYVSNGATYVCGSADVPLTGQTQSVVTRIDPDGSVPWTRATGLDGNALRCNDLDFDDGALVALESQLGTATSAVVRYDPLDGTRISATPLPGDFRRIVFPSDGRAILATQLFDVGRLDGGAFDALSTYAVAGTFGVLTDLIVVDGRPVLVGTSGVNFTDGNARLIRPAPFGQVGCGRAGRCAETTCTDLDPCTIDGCVPSTGACAYQPRAEGASCGDGLTCVSGVCQ